MGGSYEWVVEVATYENVAAKLNELEQQGYEFVTALWTGTFVLLCRRKATKAAEESPARERKGTVTLHKSSR